MRFSSSPICHNTIGDLLRARRSRRIIPGASPVGVSCARSSAWRAHAAFSNDWVVRYEGRWLQLRPASRRYGPTQSKALVCEYPDGSVEVYYRGERVHFHEIADPVREVAEARPVLASPRVRR